MLESTVQVKESIGKDGEGGGGGEGGGSEGICLYPCVSETVHCDARGKGRFSLILHVCVFLRSVGHVIHWHCIKAFLVTMKNESRCIKK